MVYGFAKQSKGQVRISSAPGEDTSVTIILPVAAPAAEVETPTPAQIHRGDGETVLLVEDDASVRLLFSAVLEELGYKATQAPPRPAHSLHHGYAENAAILSGFLGTNMQMITKPFQMQALSSKIAEMLGNPLSDVREV